MEPIADNSYPDSQTATCTKDDWYSERENTASPTSIHDDSDPEPGSDYEIFEEASQQSLQDMLDRDKLIYISIKTIECWGRSDRLRQCTNRRGRDVYVYVYGDHKRGPHLPEPVDLRIYDNVLQYCYCPEIWPNLDHLKSPIRMWTPNGQITTISPTTPYEIDPYINTIIMCPGGQPDDYFKVCTGLRELTYELHYSNINRIWTPISKDVGAPPDRQLVLREMGNCLAKLRERGGYDGYKWNFPDISSAIRSYVDC